MTPDEHVHQAELMLREATEELSTSLTQREMEVIAVHVEMAKLHVALASLKIGNL